MSTAEVRIVSAGAVGDLAELEPLARAVFGQGQRAQGWFAQKLRRECVQLEPSQLVTRSTDSADPEAWIGYGLLGRPPSLGLTARTAGVGLKTRWRGVGLGRRLVGALRDAAADGGARSMLVPASEASAPFYARCGLHPTQTSKTLLAFGTGRAGPRRRAAAWDDPCPGPARSAWLREAWERTAPERTYTVRLRDGRDRFDVSIEGSAHVAMRWTSADGDPQGPSAWLQTVPNGVPALLHEMPVNAPALPGLRQWGWDVVQISIAMLAPID